MSIIESMQLGLFFLLLALGLELRIRAINRRYDCKVQKIWDDYLTAKEEDE